jgi:endonuclease YncB( thermonuclease family)
MVSHVERPDRRALRLNAERHSLTKTQPLEVRSADALRRVQRHLGNTECSQVERPDGPAKVIDGDIIVVAGELVRLHGIDASELDQTFCWRGQQIVWSTTSLAALEALIAGVKVR